MSTIDLNQVRDNIAAVRAVHGFHPMVAELARDTETLATWAQNALNRLEAVAFLTQRAIDEQGEDGEVSASDLRDALNGDMVIVP